MTYERRIVAGARGARVGDGGARVAEALRLVRRLRLERDRTVPGGPWLPARAHLRRAGGTGRIRRRASDRARTVRTSRARAGAVGHDRRRAQRALAERSLFDDE